MSRLSPLKSKDLYFLLCGFWKAFVFSRTYPFHLPQIVAIRVLYFISMYHCLWDFVFLFITDIGNLCFLFLNSFSNLFYQG